MSRLTWKPSSTTWLKEREPYYMHTCEGDDDMPAHAKSTLTGNSLSIPITDGRLNMGIWQGIYLCEFRNRGGGRKIVATVIGQIEYMKNEQSSYKYLRRHGERLSRTL